MAKSKNTTDAPSKNLPTDVLSEAEKLKKEIARAERQLEINRQRQVELEGLIQRRGQIATMMEQAGLLSKSDAYLKKLFTVKATELDREMPEEIRSTDGGNPQTIPVEAS